MKKLNFAIFGACLLTALATRALAETTIPWTKEGCESVKGTWITAHSATDSGCDAAHCNGMNFCTSNHGNINWWSALIWCKSIGRQLANFSNVCPGSLPIRDTNAGACPNIRGKRGGWGWTNLIAGDTAAFDIGFSSGTVEPYTRTSGGGSMHAICE